MLAALLNCNFLSERFLCKRMDGCAVITRRLVQLKVSCHSIVACEMLLPETARALHLQGTTAGEDNSR